LTIIISCESGNITRRRRFKIGILIKEEIHRDGVVDSFIRIPRQTHTQSADDEPDITRATNISFFHTHNLFFHSLYAQWQTPSPLFQLRENV
jgi:hypothetical protein